MGGISFTTYDLGGHDTGAVKCIWLPGYCIVL